MASVPSLPRFEILEHPADVGFRAHGRTLAELFENAALALAALMAELGGVEPRDSKPIVATGSDPEALLYDWLSAILAVADSQRWLFRRFDVQQLEATRVVGRGWGEPLDKSRHQLGTYIKAVTWHQLRLEQTPQGWTAQVYVDV